MTLRRELPKACHIDEQVEDTPLYFDPYSQALSKLQRGHERDLNDVRPMRNQGLIQPARVRELFDLIRPQLIRFPAIDPAFFESAVEQFCHEPE